MSRKNLFIVLVILALAAGAILVCLKYYPAKGRVQNQGQGQEKENSIVLFYGDGCPHCANIDEFISENKIEEKVSFTKKEIYYNASNANELKATAKICGLSAGEYGVPFLWDGSQCYIGGAEVTNFFKQKAGIQ